MKRVKILIISTIVVIICLFNINVQAETEILYGDANGDGIVNIRDITMIQSYLENIEEMDYNAQTRADVDKDKKISLNDVKLIQKKEDGVITDLPVMMGDVNNDGIVDDLDATEIQKYISEMVSLDPKQLAIADVDCNDYVDIIDTNIIREYIKGNSKTLPLIEGKEIIEPDESEAEADPTVPSADEPTNTQSKDKEEVVNVGDTLATIPIIISVISIALIAVGGTITSIIIFKKQDNKM